MKKKWWTIAFETKKDGGFYFFKGTETEMLEEVKKLKARHKANGRRYKISYEEVEGEMK